MWPIYPVWRVQCFVHRNRWVRLIRNPIEDLQLTIRMCGMAPWVEDLVDAPVRHEYSVQGLRSAFLLCLALRVDPGHALRVQELILGRWQSESAAFWSADELRAALRG